VPEPRKAPLCGNSIATDRGFIIRDMPALDAHLHYRMIDVSSIKELARRWYRRVYFGQPAKGLAHRALADIHESVQELRYYRATIFVPPPGPSSDEAAAAAAAVLGSPAEPGAGLSGTDPASGEQAGEASVTEATAAAMLGAAAGAGSASGPSLAAGAASALGEERAEQEQHPVVPDPDQPLD
jgi:hypothetical protein